MSHLRSGKFTFILEPANFSQRWTYLLRPLYRVCVTSGSASWPTTLTNNASTSAPPGHTTATSRVSCRHRWRHPNLSRACCRLSRRAFRGGVSRQTGRGAPEDQSGSRLCTTRICVSQKRVWRTRGGWLDHLWCLPHISWKLFPRSLS